MSTFTNASEAFDFLANIPTQLVRMREGSLSLQSNGADKNEREWLDQAISRLEVAFAPHQAILTAHLALPELEPARGDYAKDIQNEWVDALEKLYAGITYHAGSRAPILEVLFPKQKLSALRKANAATLLAYNSEFEKRALGSYAQRMLASSDFEFATSILRDVRARFNQWQGLLAPNELSPEQQEKMRRDLQEIANCLVTVFEQSRLLAKAALLPLGGIFEELELHARPKRRALRLSTMPLIEETGAAPEENPTANEALSS